MKKNYKHTIAIDIDGVLANFEGEFCDRFGDDNRHLVSLSARYPDVDKDLIDEFSNDPNTYADLVPYFGGIHLCYKARECGLYVLLISSRPKHLAEVTRNWLEGYDVPYNELIYSKDKAEVIKEYNQMYPNRPVRCLVDDVATNLENLPSGVIGVAWNRSWNAGFYPMAYYDEALMKILIKMDTESSWRGFWENENE